MKYKDSKQTNKKEQRSSINDGEKEKKSASEN